MSLALITALVLLVALIAYALTAGADFGGGVWALFARGPRKAAQQELIAHAIAPIWEANHVWLILVVVLLFVAFPGAFAALSIRLHVPLTLMLIGVVLRGSAFVFDTYDPAPQAASRAWRAVFSIASTLTPIMLGVCLGAAASGAVRRAPDGDFFSAWLAPFPLLVGALVLALFSLTAAVYLTLEASAEAAPPHRGSLQDDFRARALGSAILTGVLAWACVLAAEAGAPRLYTGLLAQPWSLPFQIVTGLCALALIAALWRRWFRLARVLVGAQVALVIAGLAGAHYPYLIAPDFLIEESAAPPSVLRLMLLSLLLGGLLLSPALVFLYRLFKARVLAPGTSAAPAPPAADPPADS